MAVSQHYANHVLSESEKAEVQQAWRNIKRRREERAQSQYKLYSNRAIFLLSLLGPYMGGILAHYNLKQLGKIQRGRRVRSLSILGYIVVLVASILSLQKAPGVLNGALPVWLLCGYSLLSAILITNSQSRDARMGFEARAKPVSSLIPALFTLVIFIIQGFVAFTVLNKTVL